jgi:hypothetical protein
LRRILLTFGAFMWAINSVQAHTLVLGYRPGGFVMAHIREADRWLRQGIQIEVTDWQMSSAAMQIVYFFRMGGAVCYRDSSPLMRAYLQFHQPQANGLPVEDYRPVFIHYMGEQTTELIGSVVVDDFKAIHASKVGIPLCL